MTPFILILFSFVSVSNDIELVQERIIDTLLGSLVALGANYFILPNWESRQKSPFLIANVKANLDYLLQILLKYDPENFSITAYKLARKEVYIQTSNLGSAFQRMLQEPKHKQKNISLVYQFLVLNHILVSYLSTLSLVLDENGRSFLNLEVSKMIRKIYASLKNTSERLGGASAELNFTLPVANGMRIEKNADDAAIKEQLVLILKATTDIEKLTKTMDA